MIIPKGWRSLSRFQQILNVLIKHGFGYLIDELGIAPWISRRRLREPGGKEYIKLSIAARFRLSLEELGPTFIKFGQMLSTRSDLFPEEFVSEFKKLRDEVPPFDFSLVREEIVAELGENIWSFFHSFEEKPLAAASLAQGHRAFLLSGEEVLVKVQRPNIEKIIETDLDILMRLAQFLQTRTNFGQIYNLVDLVKEFASNLRDELVFTIEGHNADKFRDNFKDDPFIYIPKVYWDYTTRKILTMELIKGCKIEDVNGLDSLGIEGKAIASKLVQITLKQIFVHGFFHGDPHPGNIFVLPGERIAYIDFGIVGQLDRKAQEDIASLFLGVFRQDIDLVMEKFLSIGIFKEEVDERSLRRELNRLIAKFNLLPRQEFKLSEIIKQMMGLISKYGIQVPADFALMGKVLAVVEGVGWELDRNFDLKEAARPFIEEYAGAKLSPVYFLSEARDNLIELSRLVLSLPRQLNRVLSKAERGDLHIKFEHENLDRPLSRLEYIFARLSFSVIVAAFIVASALVLATTGKGAFGQFFFLMGIIAFFIAIGFGIWLLISMLRSGRL